MAIQKSVALRNAQLDAIETTIGTSALLRLYSGSAPANCAASATGTLLAEMSLPSDYLADASSGSKDKSGTWEDSSANASGTIGYFRFYDSGGTTCHVQGTVTATSGGGDIEVDNTSVASGQKVTISSLAFTAGGA